MSLLNVYCFPIKHISFQHKYDFLYKVLDSAVLDATRSPRRSARSSERPKTSVKSPERSVTARKSKERAKSGLVRPSYSPARRDRRQPRRTVSPTAERRRKKDERLVSPSPFYLKLGVVGWREGVVYLMSLGRPTDIGFSWARPAILVAGKDRGRGDVFISSVSSLSFLFLFLPCPSLSSFLLSLLSLFSLTLGDDTK